MKESLYCINTYTKHMKESLYIYIHKTYERVFVLFYNTYTYERVFVLFNTYTKHMKESLYCLYHTYINI